METVAKKISEWMGKNGDLDEDQKEIIEYAIIWLGTSVGAFIAIVVIGYFWGLFWECLVASSVSALLRLVSGGVHLSTPNRCFVFSVITFVSLGAAASLLGAVFPFYTVELVLLLLVVGVIALIKYIPDASPRRPISGNEAVRFRYISAFILLSLCFLLYFAPHFLNVGVKYAIFLGVMWQLFTLTPLAHRFIKFLERCVINRIIGGGLPSKD